MIYTHRATVTVAGGSIGTTPLRVHDGLVQQVLIRALTSGLTMFRANLTDEQSLIRRHYAFHEGEINDVGSSLPIAGTTTVNITNASATDTFQVALAVQEV